ncbi:hypothetical protein [Candidatus Ichthyocystis sparus]|uniref:hypothetical protein n=1 Tax=Candidatus Ichthyocystis sparus TaxID=1561004 RepID=UPI000B87B836|nr:hypothetical protein [Candidatus Ichthyocystis sparus]
MRDCSGSGGYRYDIDLFGTDESSDEGGGFEVTSLGSSGSSDGSSGGFVFVRVSGGGEGGGGFTGSRERSHSEGDCMPQCGGASSVMRRSYSQGSGGPFIFGGEGRIVDINWGTVRGDRIGVAPPGGGYSSDEGGDFDRSDPSRQCVRSRGSGRGDGVSSGRGHLGRGHGRGSGSILRRPVARRSRPRVGRVSRGDLFAMVAVPRGGGHSDRGHLGHERGRGLVRRPRPRGGRVGREELFAMLAGPRGGGHSERGGLGSDRGHLGHDRGGLGSDGGFSGRPVTSRSGGSGRNDRAGFNRDDYSRQPVVRRSGGNRRGGGSGRRGMS